MEAATFAMGCFWHPDALFGCQFGVLKTRVGYTSGTSQNPTYLNLSDHSKAIDISYDPTKINYEELLKLFWKNHDPTVQQIRQHRSAIFYRDAEQKALALKSKQDAEKKIGRPVLTSIESFGTFYNAEDCYQKFYLQTHHLKHFHSLNIKTEDLVDSEVAAKLNGYVVAENTLESFNAISKSLGLSAEDIDYVKKMIARGKQSHC